jgi:UDP-galactopyranose mutase
MIELKQFHLYARLPFDVKGHEDILSRFENQYWFDHKWTFGMHQNCFYTLPFHFDHLYEFYDGFNDFKSNNREIFINNPRIWFNVKSIELLDRDKFDNNFLKELKIKIG